MRNSLHTALIFLMISFGLMFFGHMLGGRQGMLLGFILAIAFISIIYFNSDVRIKKFYAQKKLEGQDPWGLLPICEDLAKKVGIPTPEIYLYPFPAPNALAVGRSWNNAAIILSEKLLEHFSLEEVRSILCLNFIRIQQMNVLSIGIASAISGFVLGITSFLDNLIFWRWSQYLSKTPFYGPFSKLLFPVVHFIFILSSRKQVFFRNDQLAAEVLDDGSKIAEVLWKLNSFATTSPMEVPVDMSVFFIVNPLSKKWPLSFFHISPRFDQRIKKLTGHFPL